MTILLKRSFYKFNSDEEFDFNGKSCHDPSMGETEKVWKVIKFVASFIIPFAVISELSLRAKTYLTRLKLNYKKKILRHGIF